MITDLQNILFLDIESVSQSPDYYCLDDRGQKLWQRKTAFMARNDAHVWCKEDFARSYAERAAIYAEFGKVIVISTGIIKYADNGPSLRITSFYGHDEKQVLADFALMVENNFNNPKSHVLCGHNIREFDIPYLCRRMTVHQITFPTLFNISGKKPWEIKHLADTLELWKFGDYKNFTSLDLLAYTLNIPSPKNNLDGSMVGHAYWIDHKLEEIKQYCERDVVAVAQVYLRLHQMSLLDDDQKIILVGNSVQLTVNGKSDSL